MGKQQDEGETKSTQRDSEYQKRIQEAKSQGAARGAAREEARRRAAQEHEPPIHARRLLQACAEYAQPPKSPTSRDDGESLNVFPDVAFSSAYAAVAAAPRI